MKSRYTEERIPPIAQPPSVYQAWLCEHCGLKGTVEAPCTWDAKQFHDAALRQHEALTKEKPCAAKLRFSGTWQTAKPAGL